METDFIALRSGEITLYLINEQNVDEVRAMFSGFADSEYMLNEIEESYLPEYDQAGRRTKFGFYSTLNDTLAGLSLLGIDSWQDARGYTGADTLVHMRGQGVAPGSKPQLFYLGFYLLELNRIESGCSISNLSSKRSIEKTPGFQLEGILRQFRLNEDGKFEDEYRYAILKQEWLELYDPSQIEVIR